MGLSVALVFFGPFLLLAMNEREELRRSTWTAAMVALYGSGFLFVYFTYRYVEPVLKPLCILACFGLASAVARRIREIAWPSASAARWLGRAATVGVIVSFALHVGVPFEPHRIHEPGGTPFDDITVDSRPHRALAARIRAEGLPGPVASDLYWAGRYVAYFLGEPYAGSPADGEDLVTFGAGLERTGVRTVVLSRDGRFAGTFSGLAGWSRAFSLDAAGTRVDVYARR